MDWQPPCWHLKCNGLQTKFVRCSPSTINSIPYQRCRMGKLPHQTYFHSYLSNWLASSYCQLMKARKLEAIISKSNQELSRSIPDLLLRSQYTLPLLFSRLCNCSGKNLRENTRRTKLNCLIMDPVPAISYPLTARWGNMGTALQIVDWKVFKKMFSYYGYYL